MKMRFYVPKTNIRNPFTNTTSQKRTLGEGDKKILYRLINKHCENCDREIEFDEMQVGHKKAYSKGGKSTLANSVGLCYRCNNLQRTDSWETFRKKQNKPVITTATSHLQGKRGSKVQGEKVSEKTEKPKKVRKIKRKIHPKTFGDYIKPFR